MHYFEFATADATLYEGEATQSVNTGLDPILEVRKDMNDTGTVINVSRALVKFNESFKTIPVLIEMLCSKEDVEFFSELFRFLLCV